MKLPALIIAFIFILSLTNGQPPQRISTTEYINLYKGDAIKDMMKMGVPASITLAQGILESESGNSDLAREAKNHFGIKCHKEWVGETFHKDDDEKDECFRKYRAVLDSYDDHGRFLRERPRYAFLFDYTISDYKKWAHGLKQAGYATNPRYADMLIKLIEEHNLHQYDAGGRNIPVVAGIPVPVAESAPAPHHQKHVKVQPEPVNETKSGILINAQEVPYIIAGKEDSWFSVAIENDMRLWQILKYNDVDQNHDLTPGTIVYLKPKRGAPAKEFHLVQSGETLWNISQEYCVKMKKLVDLNDMENGIAITQGQKVRLK